MITLSKLKNLPVFTKSGVGLGKIMDIEFDEQNQTVLHYYVKTKVGVFGLWQSSLLISPEQVLSLTDKSMIVEDLEVTDKTPISEPTA